MNPSNIYFGNPNDTQITTPMSSPMSIQQENVGNEKNKDVTSNKNKESTKDSSLKPTTDEIFAFLNVKVSTILTFSIAIAIGFALKDFMNALVMNILQPMIMLTIMFIDRNNYLPITQSLRERQVSIDVAKFMGNLLVLKLVIGSMYFAYKYSNILF